MKRCAKCGKELADDALFCPRCGTKQVLGAELVGNMVADRYLVQREIGRGGSGTVYRARHVALGTHVAIKVLHPSLSSDESAIERFRKEAVTVASIDNDHVVHVFDFGRLEDGRFYMVMELLEGRTLDEVLSEGRPLSLDRAVGITSQAADALAEVHALGLVHRDLRPRNIFLAKKKGRDDFVKILDFGMSKLLSPGLSPQATLGVRFSDPVYIAPEQVRGEPVDRRTDIYSLAVIFYQMVTGRPPFSGTGAVAVLDQQLDKMPPAPSTIRKELSPLVDAAVLKALAKKPQTRFDTMLRFREALLKALGKAADSPAGAVSGPDGPTADSGAIETRLQSKGTPVLPEAPKGVDIPPDQTVLGIGGPVVPPAPEKPAAEKAEGGQREAAAEKAEQGQQEDAGEKAEQGQQEAAAEKAEQGQQEAAAAKTEEGEQEAAAERAEVGEEGSGDRNESAGGEQNPDPTMSQLWYAEGEEAQRALAALESGEAGSQATLPAMYHQLDSGRHGASGKTLLVLTLAGLGVVGLLVGILVWHQSSQKKGDSDSESSSVAQAEQDASLARRADGGAGQLAADASAASRAVDGMVSNPENEPAVDAGILALPREELVVTDSDSSGKTARPRGGRRSGAGRPPARHSSRADSRHSGNSGELPRPPDDSAGTDPNPPGATASLAEELAAGRKALRSGDLAGARRHFSKAKALGGGWRALAGLGEVAFEQGQYSKAVSLLRRASRSGNLRTLLLLGDAYFKSGNLRKAKAAYERVLKKSPSNRAAKRNLEVVRRRLGQ